MGKRGIASWLAVALFAVAAFAPQVAETQTDMVRVNGVSFPRMLARNGAELALHRAVLYRHRRIIRAYTIGLYLGQGVETARVLDDVPKRLDLYYHVAIDGEDFGPAALEIMSQMYRPEQIAPLRARLDALHAQYRNIRPGDRYTLTYVPGTGTELALNGRALATVEGADFQRAYFSIWLGRRPISGHLRDELLANE